MNDLKWMTSEQIRREKLWDVVQIIDKRVKRVPLGYSVGCMGGDSYTEETEYLCLLRFKESTRK